MSKRPAVQPKTYRLFNAASGTVFTLSARDHSSVAGAAFNANGNAYQEWMFIPTGESDIFLIKSAAQTPEGSSLYLTVNNALLRDAKLIAAGLPMPWKVYDTRVGSMIIFPQSDLLVEMGGKNQMITLQNIPEDEDLLSETDEYGQVVIEPRTAYLWRCSRLHRDKSPEPKQPLLSRTSKSGRPES